MNMLKAKNRRPTHPGAILREDVLPSLNITQTELADRLGGIQTHRFASD